MKNIEVTSIKSVKEKTWKEKASKEIKEALKNVSKGIFLF